MNKELIITAKAMRLNVLRLAANADAEGKGAHIAPSLSIVEILAVLFICVLRSQDDFILSKGHGGLAYYTALKEAKIITNELLDSFEEDGGDFPGQPSKNIQNGIICSSGSLGMGLSYACGLALVAKRKNDDRKIYVLLGDGELNEGSNWESVMFAKHQKLNNLVAVVDHNSMQSDGISSEIIDVDLEGVFKSFGWNVRSCDGHSVDELSNAFVISETEAPTVILAKTIKGKGVSFMENNNAWHHNRLNEEQYQNAIREVERRGV